MKFLEFEREVKGLLESSCKALGYSEHDLGLVLPPSAEYGDLATSLPLRVAKATSRRPSEVATEVASHMEAEVKSTRYVGSVTPHRGGYVNFGIRFPAFIADTVEAVNSGDLGAGRKTGRSVAVEHTNVNPNKALHIGHARNLVLGDSLVRVLRYLGDEVQALDYVDDSGAQVADVVVGFKFLGIPKEAPEGTKFDVYCGDSVYVRVNSEYARDPTLKLRQSAVLKEVEEGKGELARFTKEVVDKILAAQLETCWRLGASYDLLNWESQLVHSGLWARIFETLKASGYVRLETGGENKGCWVIPDPETGEQKVVVRSDGTAVYVAKDIPYAAWKLGVVDDPFAYEAYKKGQPDGRTLYSTVLRGGGADVKFGGARVAISVIDVRQSYLQRIVAKVLEKLEEGSSKRYFHRAYEVVALSKRTSKQLGFEIEGEFAHMSGRKGLYVNVDTVLEALKAKARMETRQRNQKEEDQWVEDTAEAVAVSALRYDLLKQDPDKIIVFDMEDSLNLQGDTGPYLLYTYARALRILEKSEGRPSISHDMAGRLDKPQERALAKKLSMLDVAVASAGEYLSPREVAKFAHGLASTFNEFYESVQVNREADPGLRDARLALVKASSMVLAESMRLMGLPRRPRI